MQIYSTVLHMKSSVSNMHVDFRGEVWGEKKNVLNYYTRVNMATKIKKQQACQSLFSIIWAGHRLPIVKWADCDGPKCERHARHTSTLCQTSFICFHIVFLRHHSKIRRQLQLKVDKTLFKVQIRIKFLARHSSKKTVIFKIFCTPEAKSSCHWRSGERYLNPCCLHTFSNTEFGQFLH